MLERGLLQPGELERRPRAAGPPPPLPRVLRAADVAAVLARGSPTARPGAGAAPSRVGDAVRLRSGAVPHHTRLPGYARGKRGTITAVHGPHVFADAHAQGLGEQPRPLYTRGLQRHRAVGRRARRGRPDGVDRRLGALPGGGAMTIRPARLARRRRRRAGVRRTLAGAGLCDDAGAAPPGPLHLARMGRGAGRRDRRRAGRRRRRPRRHLLPPLAGRAGAPDGGQGPGSAAELESHRQAWAHAADRTPHGQPIVLRGDDFAPP